MSLDKPIIGQPVVVVREPGRTALVLVLHAPLEIGRDCSGLLIDDPQVSRSHVQLRPTEEGVVVVDMESTNGTFLDGERLEIPAPLSRGSEVRLGDTTIMLHDESMPLASVARTSGRTSIERIADQVVAEGAAPPALKPDATVTIVFTDIESSTELSNLLGDEVWFNILSEHNKMLRERVAEYRGQEVKAQGDGFMLAFDSTRRALLAMIEAQRDITASLGRRDPPLRIRVGAHTGEAIADEAGDLYGYHVNLAARIADQASGGEILVSELLKQIGESRGDVTFGDPREAELKGFTGTHRMFPVIWDGDPKPE